MLKIKSILQYRSFPIPAEQAAKIAIEKVLSNITVPIEKVIFCCPDSDAGIYRKIYAKSRVET